MVGIAVRTTEPNSEIVVEVTIDEIAAPTRVGFKLDRPGEYLLYPMLKYDYPKLRSTLQPAPVTVT